MKKNKIFLLITLILLLSSVSYATVSNDTTSGDDTSTTVQTSTQSVEQNVITEKTDNDKEIKKTIINNSTKTANKIMEVKNYDNLTYALSDNDKNDITLNIQSDITLSGKVYLNNPNKIVIINGNGHRIDGNKSHNFLDISKNNIVIINNLVITNCVDDSSTGTIHNEGDLTLNQVKFVDNNKVGWGSWCIDTNGKLNIQNSEFINTSNEASSGLIRSKADLTINKSQFIENYEHVIDVENSAVLIENSAFKRNSEYYYNQLYFTNCSVILNNINASGGLSSETSKLLINSAILTNFNTNNNRGTFTLNNSILAQSYLRNYGNLTVTNSTFKNTATTGHNGGGINNNGNLSINSSKFFNITNDETDLNYMGGAVYTENGIVKINNSIFSDNKSRKGGALALRNSTLNIENSSFSKNTAYFRAEGNIYHEKNHETTISDSKFAETGITIRNGSMTVTKTEFNNAPLISNNNLKLVNVDVKSNKASSSTLNYVNATIINSTFTKTGEIATYNYYAANIKSNLNIINSVFQDCVDVIHCYNINITNSTFNKVKSDEGVIRSIGNVKITNSKFTNNIQEMYSPIGILTLRGNDTISNTIFKNNTSRDGTIFTEGKLIIKNCNFTNNNGSYEGGVITNRGNVSIDNCIFTNNRATYGGVLHNSYRFMTIKNSIIKNNTAIEDGGAINNHGRLILSNVSLTYNSAGNNGGAIYSELCDYKIYNSTISFNKAGNNGGAIYGNWLNNGIYDDLKDTYIENLRKDKTISTNIITGNTISYNTAGNNGGAIYEKRIFNIIKNNTFSHNTAKKGSAIYTHYEIEYYNVTGYETAYDPESDKPYQEKIVNGTYNLSSSGNMTILNNRFIQNPAKIKGSAIIINGSDNKVNKNTNDTLSIYSSTIQINGHNNTITNNIFEDKITYTKITLTVPTKTTINGTKITIKGKLTTYEGKILPNTNIKLKINTKTITLKTDNKGTYNYTTKLNKTGTNTVTTTYTGNTKYAPSNITKTFKVIIGTKITINKMTTTQYKDNIIIKGKLTKNNGAILANTQIKLKINNRTATLKTNKQGIYNYTHKTYLIGKNNVTITFKGNTNYNASTTKTTFTVTKRTTKATITKITQKTYKQNMTITGKLTDKTGTILKNTNIKVKVNSKTYNVKTNSKGIYTLKVVANKVGTNNVTVTYAGNKYYETVTKKTTFKTVARATKLTVNKISTTIKDKTVKITGKLTDNLKSPVVNSLVKININKKTVSVKTNKQGVYTYTYKTNTKGTNNVTLTFSGSTNYKMTTTKTSFKVK